MNAYKAEAFGRFIRFSYFSVNKPVRGVVKRMKLKTLYEATEGFSFICIHFKFIIKGNMYLYLFNCLKTQVVWSC